MQKTVTFLLVPLTLIVEARGSSSHPQNFPARREASDFGEVIEANIRSSSIISIVQGGFLRTVEENCRTESGGFV